MSNGGFLGRDPMPTNQLEIAKKQARLLGCPEDTSKNIVECLKKIPAEKYENAFLQFKVSKSHIVLFLII